MKIFRGLTFKIFIILFITFTIAFGFVILDKYNDYYKKLIYSESDTKTDMSYYSSYLASQFNEVQKSAYPNNYTIEALKKDLRNSPKTMNSLICLLDENGNLVEQSGFHENDNYLYVTKASTTQSYNTDIPTVDHYYIDISSLSKDQISLLEKGIASSAEYVYFYGEIQKINDFQYSSINTKDIQEKYYIVYPTYLYYNYDILGSMPLEYANKGSFNGYIDHGKLIETSEFSIYTNWICPLSYQQINSLVDQAIDDHFADTYIHSLGMCVKKSTVYNLGYNIIEKDVQIDRNDKNQIKELIEDKESFEAIFKKINDKNSYTVSIDSLFTNQNDNNLSGYLVCFYNFSDKGSQSVISTLYEDNKKTFFGAFLFILLFSYLISYMITRRIRQIDNAAMKIADNNFDIQLSTHGHDELSSLSTHINTMSFHLKKNINQLQLEIDHVKKMENIRKEFVAHFTHEIKTPLAIINGNIDLLEETNDQIKKEQYISIINKEIIIINDLVLQMLDLSRLEAKAIVLDKQNINLTELCEDIVDEYEQLLKDKHLLIDLNAKDQYLEADRKRIGMVIQNFLSNAIKHALYHSTIMISIENNRFSIENKGEHIRDELKEKIWQSFITDDTKGTGLGLAICRSILELHGFTYGMVNTDNGVLFYFDWSGDNE